MRCGPHGRLASALGLKPVTSKQPKRKDRLGVDRYGRTPLHDAAAAGDATHCRELLQSGFLPNAQDNNGWSPLHFAVQASATDVVALLIGAACNPNLRDARQYRAGYCRVQLPWSWRGHRATSGRRSGPLCVQQSRRFAARPGPHNRQLQCRAILCRHTLVI